jgi:hypothetical protein
VLSDATIRDGIEAGRLLVDRRLEDYLLKLRPRVASET